MPPQTVHQPSFAAVTLVSACIPREIASVIHPLSCTKVVWGMWQVFLPSGPLALLPVRDGYSNIVWSTTPAEAAELEGMSPDSFVSAVNMVRSCCLPFNLKSDTWLTSAFEKCSMLWGHQHLMRLLR